MKKTLFVLTIIFLFALSAVQAGGLSDKLLLSGAWCTFKYNKVTGYSNSKRVVFRTDGTYTTSSRGEGYSSGQYGSMASQRDARAAGLWKVSNGELYISEGFGQLQHVNTVLKRNSNGYPVIVADGVEYSKCK